MFCGVGCSLGFGVLFCFVFVWGFLRAFCVCVFCCGTLLACAFGLVFFPPSPFFLPVVSLLLLYFAYFASFVFSLFSNEAHQVRYQARHDCTRQNVNSCCKVQTSVPGPTRDGVSQTYAVIGYFSLLCLFLNCRLRSYFLL